jgi:hypothetical protein
MVDRGVQREVAREIPKRALVRTAHSAVPAHQRMLGRRGGSNRGAPKATVLCVRR